MQDDTLLCGGVGRAGAQLSSCSGDAAVRAVIAGSAGSAGSAGYAESLVKNYTRDLSVQLNE